MEFKKKKITPAEIALKIGEGLAKAALCAKVNGSLVDINFPITKDSELSIITFKDDEGKEVFRHSAGHVMSQAVCRLYKDVKKGVGPAIEDGFYQDFDLKETVSLDDLPKIEKEMEKIVKEDIKFEREELSKKEALKLFKNDKYKKEMIEELEDDTVSVYKSAEYFDLCRGPHVPSTGYVKAVKLLKVAGAYWKGDSKNKMLQRIYGTAFPSSKELKKYLKLQEEAEKRDHRKIGKVMNLFSIHDEAPGMPFFHDKGNFIWESLKDYMTAEMRELDYELNKTPIILNKALWLQSGHWDHYKENMYFTKIDDQDFAVKPMNCPGNILVFKTNMHSYRELPIKAGEFGLVHRHELSGVLSGLFRVRVFTQDDAHVFCTEDQLQEQIIELIDLVDRVYSTFGFEYHVELSTKPAKAMGDPKIWDLAEKTLESALKAKKMDYKVNAGDGAFYGPKIDYHVKDAIGRSWQCGTIQLDFSMPEKFDLTYEAQNGRKKRPVMLHRAIYGSLERFMGILIEHFAGWFPLWLNPLQVRVVSVSNNFNDYALEVVSELKKNGIRVDSNLRSETTGKKIRDAQIEKVPIVINVGEKEVEKKTVAVRTNIDGKVKFGVKLKDLVKAIKDNVSEKKIEFKL